MALDATAKPHYMKGQTMERDGIIAPHIHLNGTSKETLTADLSDAYLALSAAVEALRHSAPNARDYYPVPGLLDKATAQHLRRLELLTDMMAEIDAQIGLIDEQ